MTRENSCARTTFGYLSAVESAEHGFFGGYLLIAPNGRPLEFHCTAPIRPSRAQQILYGPTLSPYLLGEQIGGTLVREATLKPAIIITDQAAVLYLRSHVEVPLVCLSRKSNTETEVDAVEIGNDEVSSAKDDASIASQRFDLCGYQCELAAGHQLDREATVRLLTELAQHVELVEPFGRIHEAIREAQRIGRGGQDVHGQAA
jgi:hypothetical protein